MFNRQQRNVFFSAPIAKLSAIGISLPFHAAEQLPVSQTKRDEIATPAMIRPEDQFPRRQLNESPFYIDRAKTRAIPSHGDHFLISELGNLLDRVLKARREIPPGLAVNVWPVRRRISRSQGPPW